MTPQRSPDVPPSPKRRHRPSSSSASRAAGDIQMPPTAGAASLLPDEIIFDILTRVPVNSACRFRCVSREWRALISGPEFVAAHKSRHAEPLVAVYSFREEPSKGTELRLLDMDGNTVRVIKVKNGATSSKLPHHDPICITDDHSGACLVDPATGEVMVACPKENSLVTCFGRAVPSGAYKVVRFVRDERCHVLTLRDAIGWKLTWPPPTRVECYPGSVTIVNGTLHILALGEMVGGMIHCFDLESEKWTKTIEGPQNAAGHELWSLKTKTVRVDELNGILCMVQSEAQLVNIWLLTDSGNCRWIKAYAIPIAPNTYFYMPLRMTHDGGRLLFQCSLFGSRAQIVRSYDPCTNACIDVTKTPHKLVSKIRLCNLQLLDSLITNKI